MDKVNIRKYRVKGIEKIFPKWKIKNRSIVKKTNDKKVIKHLDDKIFELENQDLIIDNVAFISLPENFSISECPNVTIRLLKNIYWAGKNENVNKLVFNYEKCKKVGLSADAIMNVIVLSLSQYRKRNKSPINIVKQIVKNKLVSDILYTKQEINFVNFTYKIINENKIKPFEMVIGECNSKEKKSDIVATDMTEYFDKCLKTQGMELNLEGKASLARILGEVIDNCEIHGGEDSTWYTQGYYKIMEKESYGEMQLVFLNLGDTIYEGLKHHSSEETKQRLEHILKYHEENMSERWNEETIYTLFALQQGISRLRNSEVEGYGERGTGTVKLIEQMHAIGETIRGGHMPKMTVVSGRTYISFSGLYKMQSMKFKDDPVFGTGNKKIIAFNKDNDIYKPADSNNVKMLEESFPGTVISLKFYLDSRYIIQKKQTRRKLK